MTQDVVVATEHLRGRTILALVAAVVVPLVGLVMGAMLTYDFREDGPHEGPTARNRKAAQVAAVLGAVVAVPWILAFGAQIIGMFASLIPAVQ